jgi:hypothetical protein
VLARKKFTEFKRILAPDLGFGNMRLSDPVVFGMHRSRRAWTLLSQVKKINFFHFGCLSQIDLGLSTCIKFLPQSQEVADMDTMTLTWCFFSVLSMMSFSTPSLAWRELAYKLSLALTVMSTSAILVSMTALFYTWEWWC